MSTPTAPSYPSTARREILALTALGLLAFAAAWRFALFDRLLVTILVMTPALGLYAWRRWRESRRTLADLRVREAQLGLLTRQLPAFLWTTDADLRLTAFSGGGFRRDGIDPRGRVGLTVAQFFGVDDPAFPPLAAHRRALGGEPAEYPLHRDGRDYEVRVEPLRDAAGAIVGTLGLGVDVTERKRAAAALRDSEARFQALFAHAAIGIGLSDLDRRPLMVNPALARFTGYDSPEELRRPIPEATHPADAARDRELYAELVAGVRDHYQIEKRYRRKDDAEVWGRLTTSLVRDENGAPQYAIGMVEDITARVAADAALRASEARLRTVVEHAPLILVTLDAAGVVTFAAGRGLDTLGHSAEQIVGYPLLAAGPYAATIGAYARRALEGEAVEERVAVGDHIFATHYAPLYDEAGAVAGVIGVATDVTARVTAERAARRLALHLSPTEERVLPLLARADLRTYHEVGTAAYMGGETARGHAKAIARKFGLATSERVVITATARDLGLLSEPR